MNTCKTCRHPDRLLIDAALVHSVPFRTVSEKFNIGIGSLKRHAAAHIPELLAKAKEAEEVLQADVLLAETVADRNKVRELFEAAASSEYGGEDPVAIKKALRGDRTFAVQASGESRKYTELLLKATGSWLERHEMNISGELTHKVEQQEAETIRFIKECHPRLLPELASWGKEQLRKEQA